MLPTLKTDPIEFSSASAALDDLESRVVQRFVLPVRDLRIDADGRASHVGLSRIGDLQELPVTDVVLRQVDGLAGIPSHYAENIEPALHEISLRDLLSRRLSVASVFVEHDRGEPESRRVVGVVPGARAIVPHEIVLRRLVELAVESTVRMHGGAMDVHFGGADLVEVFPRDSIDLRGLLRNNQWGDDESRRPVLEVGLWLLRLVCANGCHALREIASGRAFAMSTERDLVRFVERQLGRVLEYPRAALQAAAERMAESIPGDEERSRVRALITRHAGLESAEPIMADVVSAYDLWNATTGAAHRARTEAGRRRLQVAGGAMLDDWLERTKGVS